MRLPPPPFSRLLSTNGQIDLICTLYDLPSVNWQMGYALDINAVDFAEVVKRGIEDEALYNLTSKVSRQRR
jgi:hypothetical protein